MTRTLLLGLLSTALLLSTACEEPLTACEEAAQYDARLEIGVGEDSFKELRDGDLVPLAWGSQGGRHIWMSVRTTGVDPGVYRNLGEDEPGPEVTFELLGNGIESVGYGSSYLSPMRGEAAEAELVGQMLFVEWVEPGLYDHYVLRVEVSDSCGTTLSDELEVVLPE